MSDPKRLLDSGSGGSAAMRELLRAGRTDLPDEAQLDGIGAGLAALTGLAAGPVPAPVPPSVGPAPVPAAGAGAGTVGGAGAAAAGGAAATGGAATGLKMAVAVKVAAMMATVGAAAGGVYAGARAPRVAPAPRVVVVTGAPVVPVAPVNTAPAPTALPPLDEAPPERPPAPAPIKSAASPTETELSLLESAQDRLSTDPAGALAVAERHRTRFPRGALAQEREVIAIEALVRMQRLSEARARADRFVGDFPTSAHRARVEALLADVPRPDGP